MPYGYNSKQVLHTNSDNEEPTHVADCRDVETAHFLAVAANKFQEPGSVRDRYENNTNMAELCTRIHKLNVDAGWWHNLDTGERLDRNKAELLMLTVSELSEAAHGHLHALPDDKLPQYPMFDVELADVAIRLCDQIGALALAPGSYGENPVVIDDCHLRGAAITFNARRESVNGQLMTITNLLSAAMEHIRKGRDQLYRFNLWDALLLTFRIADLHKIDLFEIIEAKLAFNAQRADHKPENRKKSDGKKF